MKQIIVLFMLLIAYCTILAVLATSNNGAAVKEITQSLPKRLPAHRHTRTHHHHHHHRQHLQRNLTALKTDVELLPGYKPSAQRQNATATTRTTRLRRISGARSNFYNKDLTRQRSNSEWDYNNYNIYTNTYGPPSPAMNPGKGDDNMHDVEFIGRGGTTLPPNTLNRRAVPTVGPIPPLVPARRGYVTTTTTTTTATTARRSDNDLPITTESPFETNTINRNHAIDKKEMARRHICAQQRTITMPVKTTEVYVRPTWKHISTPCQPATHANQMCTSVQLVHEQAYRDVIRHKAAQQVIYDCCSGWARETPHAVSCMKPVCSMRCQNGGSCAGHDTCTCSSGFAGRLCEQDVNECKEEKPCDQICVNTVGSYYCKCREGFVLQADQQSCKKTDPQADDAFEARDLENDIYTGDEVDARLQRIERSLANERVHTNELRKSLQATYNVVDTLKSRLNTLEKQQQDFNRLQMNFYHTESRTNKLEGMITLLMKCRNGPNANCP